MSASPEKANYEESLEAPDWAAMAAGAWEAPSWNTAACEHSSGTPPQQPDPQRHLRSGAPASTVEALAYSLRRGVDALAEPNAVCRLAELSDDQLLEVGERLRRFKPEIARAWSADDVAVLMQVREHL